ncbi:MAG: hypothetical protein ACOYJA_10510 [Christensenellales bacterium]
MSRLLRALKSKAGMTLLEVVLGMTISTILLLGIALILPSVQTNYVNQIEGNYSRLVGDNVADALKGQLAAGRVTALTGEAITFTGDYGSHTIAFDQINPVVPGLSYDGKYYLGKQVSVRVDNAGSAAEPVYRVTVRVTSGNTSSAAPYVTERLVRPLG